jgi:ubiquinone/menaquinone biosynthesis C-methylase UbiE
VADDPDGVAKAGERGGGFQLAGDAPERYERILAPIMAPFVEALVDAAVTGTGASVLDVACGTGFAARAAMARVGPAGRVVGIDINRGMLEVAESLAPEIEWRAGSADNLRFGDGEFDAVICQQGLQFFPDPATMMAEAARVVRLGGRVAVTVWAPHERSPYFDAQYTAVREVLGIGEVASFRPSRFRSAVSSSCTRTPACEWTIVAR